MKKLIRYICGMAVRVTNATIDTFPELDAITQNVKKNGQYIRTLYDGGHNAFARLLSELCTIEIHEQNLRKFLEHEKDDAPWRRTLWVALARFAGITLKELMFEDVQTNDILLNRRKKPNNR